MSEREAPPSSSAVHGRAPPPRVSLSERGVAIGLSWSGIEGAGNQIVAAKVECGPERARLIRIWRPFVDAPGRRDVVTRFGAWVAEETRWAEGKLVVGVDFALSLAETHLRQLGVLRQGLRGPAVLGRNLHDRFVGASGDFTEAAARFRAELGKDVARALLGVCSYRDDDRDGVARASIRAAILRTLRTAAKVEFEMEQAAQIVEDAEGDHLDAILSATGAAAAWGDGFRGVPSNVPRSEGWIHSIREEPWR